MNGRRRLIGSFNHGSMANALPQAIGAQASQPGRQVVALSGDGGMAMLLGELLTLRQQRLPVKVVVFNNGALSFVELEMKAAGIVTFGTDLDNPDFAAIARAAGLFGVQVDKADELEGALREAFASRRPRPGRRPDRPARAVAAAQADLRPAQGLHPVRDQDDPVRRRRRARRAGQDEPAPARGRVTTPLTTGHEHDEMITVAVGARGCLRVRGQDVVHLRFVDSRSRRSPLPGLPRGS